MFLSFGRQGRYKVDIRYIKCMVGLARHRRKPSKWRATLVDMMASEWLQNDKGHSWGSRGYTIEPKLLHQVNKY